MSTENKRGPWSEKEKAYIADQAGKKTPEEIAEKICRNKKVVKNYMTKQGLMKYYYKEALEQDSLQNIRKSRYWDILKEQFTDKELDDFEYHWKNIVKQFRDDILHTEEIQIVDAIKLQIMMDRNQKKQKQASDMIFSLREQIEKERKKYKPDDKLIENLSRDIAHLYSGIEALDKDHVMLLKEKNTALSKLKATREQRIQEIESKKQTLVSWFKALYKDPKLSYELGLDMEKMRIAAKEEYQRLSGFFNYADGMIDRPILNHETVCLTSTQNNTNQEENTEKIEQIPDTTKPEENV